MESNSKTAASHRGTPEKNPGRINRIAASGLCVSLRWLGLLVALHALPAQARDYVLRPDSGSGTGMRVSDMDWRRGIAAGDTITLSGGTYIGSLTLSLQGTATRPIVLRAAAGQTPVLQGSLSLAGASYVTISGLTIRSARQAGLAIRDGSHHISVRNNSIQDTGLGIWIGPASANGVLIEHNTIARNRTHGIAIDKADAGTEPATLRYNRIFDNLHHGIEINGNHFIVEDNEIFRNGSGLPGTSGIHCFARDAAEGMGQHNIIRRNMVWGQKDKAGPDGNGIQLDRWADNNQVYHNIVRDNDGAGIHIFHAAHNTISRNTLVRNMQDEARSHEALLKGDLVIIDDRELTPRTDAIQADTNLIVSRHLGVVPLVIDVVRGRDMRFSNNQLYHENGHPSIRVGQRELRSVDDIRRLAPSASGNRFAPPLFRLNPPIRQEDFAPLPAAGANPAGAVAADGSFAPQAGGSLTARPAASISIRTGKTLEERQYNDVQIKPD